PRRRNSRYSGAREARARNPSRHYRRRWMDSGPAPRGASRNGDADGALLHLRPQNLHQLAVDELVAAHDVSGHHRIAGGVDVADRTSGFANHDQAGGDVPGVQVAFPVAVEAAGGDEGEVEGGGAEAAQSCDAVLDRGHLAAEFVVVAAADMRQPAGDDAFV